MSRDADHQTAATAMQRLASPLTHVPVLQLIDVRITALDDVFWGREWDRFASSAWDAWEASRAALMGQRAVALAGVEV